MPITSDDRRFMQLALEEARIGLSEGGIPIGSVLVIDGQVRGRGRNRRVQSGSPILHGETDCLQNAGRLTAADYRRATLYTTLSPCEMCTGAILLYKIPRVVMAENRTFTGAEETLARHGVELLNLESEAAVRMMQEFIRDNPELWNEDIGE
ncbi:MAG: nucleoside deaminase [Candidatus Brocadia sp.]|nr:MAG: nucleoside deaminase [Candidatus Brocadia sp.]